MSSVVLQYKVHEETLQEIIKANLKESSDAFNIVLTSGSSKGDGYAGVIYRASIINKKTDKIELNLIIKAPPENPVRREMFTNDIFNREAYFYDHVYPMYKNFQEEKGIDVEKDGFYQVPICYKTITESPHEVLFLEDLKAVGFELFDRFKTVKEDQVFLVMKALARMHALYYALKYQNPKLVEPFSELPEVFLMIMKDESNPMIPWFETLKEQTLEVVMKIGNKDMIEKITNLLKFKFDELLKNIFNREKIEPYAALCHGDCWNNNMLFRFDEEGRPIDLKLLDFQVLRYASPVCDLVYYIFGATEKSLRDKYYQDFLNVYYDELSLFICILGSNPDELYPKHIFESHLKQFGHFGFLMAMLSLPIMTNDTKDVPDFDKLAEDMKRTKETGEVNKDTFSFAKPKNYEKYEERMMGVCNDMYNLGYF